MTRVLLLCGGRSEEHEVSLASAASVLGATRGRLRVTPLVLGRDGRPLPPARGWAALERAAGEPLGAPTFAAPNGRTEPPPDLAALASRAAGANRNEPDRNEPGRNEAGRKDRGDGLDLPGGGFDVVFPLLHGPFGEDGTVQGLFEIAALPYVGSGVLGSAVGMDKPTMKAVFAAHGLPQVAYGVVTRHAWRTARADVLAALEGLPWPRFVKPANLGSSVGIARAEDPGALADAVERALGFDRRVIVEEGASGIRELEVAVLGNDAPEASPVGEIRFGTGGSDGGGGFYDYATKYTEGAAELIIPAEVPAAVAARCRALALRAFAAVDAAGLARVDFFWQPGRGEGEGGDGSEGELLLNEINTMPGFTRTSMYPKLWSAAGVPYGDLVERLVALALEPR